MRKDCINAKIDYLEDQLVSLNHFLPDTYDYLMAELDAQRRLLAEIEVNEIFLEIDAQHHGTALLQMGQEVSEADTSKDRDRN
jgi:hypothetical protein